MKYVVVGGVLVVVLFLFLSLRLALLPAEPILPPSSEVQAWGEGCATRNLPNCEGDFIFLRSDPARPYIFDLAESGWHTIGPRLLRIWMNTGKLGLIERVVPLTGDPAEYQQAAIVYYGRTE